jgi:hypothetical protein
MHAAYQNQPRRRAMKYMNSAEIAISASAQG